MNFARLFGATLSYHARRQPSGISRVRIGRAGTPATSVLAGTSRVTMDPAAMTAWSPMVTPGRIVAERPTQTLAPNSGQVPDQAIVTDNDTVTGHDSCTSDDEDTLAEHKGAILGSAHLDWYRLTAQEQASARDRSGSDKQRVPPIHN